ncbi:MAG TPA: hypothetical protein VF743_12630 [Acidimicrobiales bacterium]
MSEPPGLDDLDVGGQMADQFVELLGLWTEQMAALAQSGVDPRPLVRTLASTLRTAADQLEAAAAG